MDSFQKRDRERRKREKRIDKRVRQKERAEIKTQRRLGTSPTAEPQGLDGAEAPSTPVPASTHPAALPRTVEGQP